MPNYTSNLNLYKWDKSDKKLDTITETASTMDKIDTALNNATNTANIAKTTADTAKSTADTAKSTADGIAATANSALTTANSATTTANNAVTTANAATTTANDAKTTANTVQSQFNQVVAEAGSNNPEVVQARSGEVNLNTRLDKFTSQLAEKALQTDLITANTFIGYRDYVKYGEILLPSDFPNFGIRWFRGQDGIVKHNFNVDQFKTITFDHIYYVKPDTGNDTTGDGTSGNPYATIFKVLPLINADTLVNYCIKVMTRTDSKDPIFGYFDIHNSYTPYALRSGVKLTIMPNDAGKRIRVTNAVKSLTWTLVGGSTYSATRSNVSAVTDYRTKDFYGMPTPYVKKSLLSDVQATPGTWAEISGTTYINSLDGLAPDNYDLFCQLNAANFQFNLVGGSRLALYDTDVINSSTIGATNNDGCLIQSTDYTGEFYNSNCRFSNAIIGQSMGTGDAFWGKNLKKCFSFNSVCAHSVQDCFGYNGNPTAKWSSLNLEYNCLAYDAGVSHQVQNGTPNNNSTTGHDKAAILRVGCVGFNTYGPVCVDVGECYSGHIDCHMSDDIMGAGWEVYACHGTDATNKAKAFYINCEGGGKLNRALYNLYCDVSYQNFKTNKPFHNASYNNTSTYTVMDI